MTKSLMPIEELRHSLEDALDLLQDYARDTMVPMAGDPLPSLLEQCEDLVADLPGPNPVRSVHHMACTGGTLISKCLASMPNVTLLSEMDPLSGLAMQKSVFRPTDVIYGARDALRPADDAIVTQMFHASVAVLHENLSRRGGILAIRDHAHSQFCTNVDAAGRPTLHEMLQEVGPVKSVVTVRHPLDSFLSLRANKWTHFAPFTLEEYALRYDEFLDRHAGLPIYSYEDFVRAPDTVLAQICDALDVPFVPGSEAVIEVVAMSGDSGRKSTAIAERPRRAVPEDILAEVEESPAYAALCARLGYDATPTQG